jgi:[protein-PII] uridylyltransferase
MPTHTAINLGRLELPETAPDCLDLGMLRGAGNAPGELLGALKSGLQSMDAVLAGEFWDNAPVEILVRTRAWAVEQLLLLAWERLLPAGSDMALVAVGGFGRGELHPHSDVDLMILLGEEPADAAERAAIEAFVTLLWDAGFHLGHSVRTLAECEAEARGDVVTATNLMESRLLSGPESLYAAMRADNAVERMWPGPEFFDAKFREQIERHERFEDTAYNLEPNIKEGPGGLRDIQTIGWVAKRHFGAETLHGLVDHGFLTEPEHEELRQGQLFLWRVRYALHLLAGRGEDRLLFDHQRQIAQRFGHGDPDSSNTAVEQFMQSYYRAVMQLERLNERLLQLFQEELLPDESGGGEEIGDSFRVVHGFLEVSDENLFKKRPRALLEIFLLLAKRKDVHGVRAATIRLICDHLHLIDDAFRKDQDAMDCFFELHAAAAHEPLRRAGRIHPRFQAGHRPDAVRPVPRLHGRPAHSLRGPEPEALRLRQVPRAVPPRTGGFCATGSPGDPLPGGAVP